MITLVNVKFRNRRSGDRFTGSEKFLEKIQKILLNSYLTNPGRPSMDILVRSWQDLAKILEKS